MEIPYNLVVDNKVLGTIAVGQGVNEMMRYCLWISGT